MHYKNGREAKVGDRVLVPNYGRPFIGLLTETSAGSTTCNGRVLPSPVNGEHAVTIGEVLHIEDALVPPTAPAAGAGS
jgi:hypothetical protein